MNETGINERLFGALKEKCSPDVVKKMLAEGADPAFAKRGLSLLAIAIETEEPESAKHLLKAGAVVGGNEIVLSIHYLPQLKILLKHGGDINAESKEGHSVLHASILDWVLPDERKRYKKSARVERLETLISLGADPLVQDRNKLLPLDYALLWGNKEEIDFLMKATKSVRGELDQQDEDGKTLLMRAVLENDLARVRELVARGVNTDIRDMQLHSALSWAIKRGHDDIAEFLAKNGAESSRYVRIKSEKSLLIAIQRGYLGNLWLALRGGFPAPSLGKIIEYIQPRFIPLILRHCPDVLGLEKKIEPDRTDFFDLNRDIDSRRHYLIRELLPSFMAKIENIDVGDDWKVFMQSAQEANELIRSINNKYSDDKDVLSEANNVVEEIEYAGPAWRLRTLTVPVEMADRRKSMLGGPFFTSEEYPWPRATSGKFADPVAQIDLKAVSELRSMPFGDGMLQVWNADYQHPIIRIIPRDVIETAEMTPVAPTSEGDFEWTFVPTEWVSGGGVQQILGFEGPLFSGHISLDDFASPPELKRLADLGKVLTQNDSGLHLFGTFYPVQYTASEKGLPVFLALDCDHGYFWGDSGTAQIFYRMTESGPEFSFDWSCY